MVAKKYGKQILKAFFILFLMLTIVIGGSVYAAEKEGDSKKYGGKLKLYWGTLDTSDFHRHTGTISIPHPFAETLTSLSRDGQPKPFLAESWEVSDDGLRYTFKIRNGVKFHNGRIMTAKDVMANFERIKSKVKKGWLTSAMKQVEAFSAPDDTTFVVQLKEPFAPFLNLIAEAWILAPESEGWDDAIKKPIGTGPFEFEKWTPQLKLTGPKFKDYWMEGKPYADEIEFDLREIADASLGLRAGDYHAATIPLTKVKSVEKDAGTKVVYRGDTSWYFWSYNTKNPKPPFDKPRVREAVTYALDKDAFLRLSFGEQGIKTNQMVVPGNFYYDEKIGGQDRHEKQNLDLAKKILKEENVDPSKIELRVISHQNSRYAPPTLQMLKSLGFQVVHKSYDDLGYQKALSQYEWDLFPGGSGPRNDIFLRYVRMMTDGPNPHLWGGVQDNEYDKLVTAAISTTSSNERRSNYINAWKRVMDNYYTVVVGHAPAAYGIRNGVHDLTVGFNTSAHRVDGGVAFAWLDQ
jgi:ABC-type transport system substrate-binding protein